ncbi:hypothetical protein AB1K70_15315 [Bremerella sp. JC770]|uniref:hypothetical protein n=1 Tax=Bremerella sp. JC770 TaxID=3232137 RepID=UPI003459953B
MLGRGLFLGAMCLLASSQVARAEEATLRDRLTFPQQGHLELKQVTIADLAGVDPKTVADVIQLREQLEAISFDRENILSWKFLKQLGWSVNEVTIPPSPPGVNIELVQGPAWSTIELDYTKDAYVKRKSYGTATLITASSPVTSVTVVHDNDKVSIQHFAAKWPGPTDTVPGEYFARHGRWLDQPFEIKQIGKHALYVTQGDQSETWRLLENDKSTILASIVVRRGKIDACSLHCYLEEPDPDSLFCVPRLNIQLVFRPDGCSAKMIFVDQADFKSPVQPAQFQVPVPADAVYACTLNSRRVLRTLPVSFDDLLQLTPEKVIDTINQLKTP